MSPARASLAILLASHLCAACEAPTPPDPAVDEQAARTFARSVVGDFGPRLKSALGQALKEGGPIAAVEVCNMEAPSIARASGERFGATVRRVTTRPRNPDNAADAREARQLAAFETAIDSGRPAGELDDLNWAVTDGGVEYRYLKPIVIEPVCLTCHGEAIAPELAERLDALYPRDQARGYTVGELRGAFAVRWLEVD